MTEHLTGLKGKFVNYLTANDTGPNLKLLKIETVEIGSRTLRIYVFQPPANVYTKSELKNLIWDQLDWFCRRREIPMPKNVESLFIDNQHICWLEWLK